MQSYVPDEFLASAIARLDQQGYNVINFDEFAFLPVNGDYVPDINGMQPLKYYYFYEPRNLFHMRVWRKASGLSNVAGAGHLIFDAELRLAPESLALRHYIFRNQAHAFEKYTKRTFAVEELERGSHNDRAGQTAAHSRFRHSARYTALLLLRIATLSAPIQRRPIIGSARPWIHLPSRLPRDRREVSALGQTDRDTTRQAGQLLGCWRT